ncbi:MAG: hypothetical protein AB8G23_16960 [Myxococcota bacterium]
MNETSRNQGWAICAGAAVAAFLFLVGLLNGSYLALAIPVAIITFFALGLVAWVGFTIATIQVDADHSPEILSPEPEASAHSENGTDSDGNSDRDASETESKEDAA